MLVVRSLKYRPPVVDLEKGYGRIDFVNLCISSLGIFGNSFDSFLLIYTNIGIDKHRLEFIATKLSSIIIRTTYCIFCMRNKPWYQTEILNDEYHYTIIRSDFCISCAFL